jgi:hypothetical protein
MRAGAETLPGLRISPRAEHRSGSPDFTDCQPFCGKDVRLQSPTRLFLELDPEGVKRVLEFWRVFLGGV